MANWVCGVYEFSDNLSLWLNCNDFFLRGCGIWCFDLWPTGFVGFMNFGII